MDSHSCLGGYIAFLKSLNTRRLKAYNDLPHDCLYQKISAESRATILQQMYRRCTTLPMESTIFFHAVFLFDYALAMTRFSLSNDELNALSNVAFLLAAKFEQGDIEIHLSPLEAQAEYYLFKTLNYNLTVPNMITYVRLLSWEYSDGCPRVRACAKILLLAGIHDKEYTNFTVIQLASASMMLASAICAKVPDKIKEFESCEYKPCISFLKRTFAKWKGVQSIAQVDSNNTGLLYSINHCLPLPN